MLDVYAIIFSFLPIKQLFKCKLVCRRFRDIIESKWFPRYLPREVNHLTILMEIYPDEDWDYAELTLNPNITKKYIRDKPDKPWVFIERIPAIESLNQILETLVQIHPLSDNVKLLIDNKNIDWELISQFVVITWKKFRKYHHAPWSYKWLSRNKFNIQLFL